MKLIQQTVGMISTNCYFIQDETSGQAAIVDPGGVSQLVDKAVSETGRQNVRYILLTHGHFDHIAAVKHYQQLTQAQVVIQKQDVPMLADESINLGGVYFPGGMEPLQADIVLQDGEELALGNSKIKLLHTPGHTAGSSCYLIGDSLFTGDTLMHQSVGRTDFPTGNYQQLKSSLQRLNDLEGNYTVYPGHGPATTLAFERADNPFLGKNYYDDIY